MSENVQETFAALLEAKAMPAATYRVQFGKEFRFEKAADLTSYLATLGISDLYASPLFTAREASTHGYDVCDFNEVSPALGGEVGFDRLVAALKQAGMGLLLDMVPNHMGIGEEGNRWWMDVLQWGRQSKYAACFDIDWESGTPGLKGKVLLPILGDRYGQVLHRGELQVVFEQGAFKLGYYDKRLPLSVECWMEIMRLVAGKLRGEGESVLEEQVAGFVEALGTLDRESVPGILLEVQRTLSELGNEKSVLQEAITAVLAGVNGRAGERKSFDQLHGWISRQHYRLAFWRVGPQELNYRRFFDITDLAGVRMELPTVFAASHQLLLRLLREGLVTGVRVDHPDGLWDPAGYFKHLQQGYVLAKALGKEPGPEHLAAQEPGLEWMQKQAQSAGVQRGRRWPLYVLGEKILSGKERLPQDWAVDGTTGYDYLNLLNGIFVRADSEKDFDRIYTSFSGNSESYADAIHTRKRAVLDSALVSEVNSLSEWLKQLLSRNRDGQDFTVAEIRRALKELIAALPVYRTYVDDRTVEISEADREYIIQAVAEAQRRNPDLEPELLRILQRIFLLEEFDSFEGVAREEIIQWIMSVQQVTGPAAAKGVEDTAFYVFNRLVSLNEVGGEPGCFGVSLEEFHEGNSERARLWPGSMLATSTHDTKRGEDARARLNVLSEIPAEWEQAIRRWRAMNESKRGRCRNGWAPDANDEYLLYQAFVASCPMDRTEEGLRSYGERISAYILKAAKESKRKTSWVDPDGEYEEGLQKFVSALLDSNQSASFLRDFLEFTGRVAFFGQLNSLSQLLLKIASPGVPDFYQGTELWDLSLVDPDNRRPVDFELRRSLLEEIQKRAGELGGRSEFARSLLGRMGSGQVKMYTMFVMLQVRRRVPELFRSGKYEPLLAEGKHREKVVAFAREWEREKLLVIAPRFIVGLTEGQERIPIGAGSWMGTSIELPGRADESWVDLFTGARVSGGRRQMDEVLREFPLAALVPAS